MKILYIDPVSHTEHINFNLLHLKAIFSVTRDVDCVFRENYLNNTSLSSIKQEYEIPSSLCKKRKIALVNRFFYWLTLWYIRFKVDFKKYDYIILSYYDEIALFLSFYPKNLLLINHINVSGLQSRLKFYFYNKLSKNNTQIVFEDYIKDYLISKGIKHVKVVPHGVIDRYIIDDSNVKRIFKHIFLKYKYVVFSPSSGSSDEVFINTLLYSDLFKQFLTKNDILFVVKTNIKIDFEHENILVINTFLSNEDYRYLFLKSNLILISYPPTFKYRVSAVFFEAISNNKCMQLANIEAFDQYKKYLPSQFYFKNIEELISNIYYFRYNDIDTNYKSIESKLMPDYSQVILK